MVAHHVDWYFDFVSPFSYLQTFRFQDLPSDVEVALRPVLFAGLLNHWGTTGPAELLSKRVFTYRYVHWLAKRMNVPFHIPPSHPFNPLNALRLAIALGSGKDVVFAIFSSVWRDGLLPDNPEGWTRICEAAGVAEGDQLIAARAVKEELRANGEQAVAAGVFGVPTFVFNGHVFWGVDATDFLIDALEDPDLLTAPEMVGAANIEPSAIR